MLDWLRLIRASGLATIISNSLAAVFTAFYAGEGDRLLWLLARLKHNGTEALWVLLASFLLYAAGMVWNDLIDVDRDRVGNPKRPLPAGRIGLVPAYVVGILTVLGAVLAAMHVEYGFFLAGIVLSLALLYNLVAKSVPWLGSLVMAATRAAHACFALLLLGPDYVRMVLNPGEAPPGQVAPFVYPLVLGIYIFGLTLVSELEERGRRGSRLTFVIGGLCMAFALLAAVGGLFTADWIRHLLRAGGAWPVLALLAVGFALACAGWLAFTVGRAWFSALRACKCELVGKTVVAGLGGMILLDAVVASAAHPLGGLACAACYPVFLAISGAIRMD
jgi:4-hydroxybenzoate polyprenyltransferase